MNRASGWVDYARCNNSLINRDEIDLKAAWLHAYKQMPSAEAKAKLLDEQRNWIKYKESACSFWTMDDFGTNGRDFEGPACYSKVIEDRTDQLNNYAKDASR